ncbi:MAG: 2-methylcitrate dehydratase [Candidatus Dormibacteraeota bacterium]|nr:2-methylcitrate dehydratase [Candidatus Dormibacteraeota bacterium]
MAGPGAGADPAGSAGWDPLVAEIAAYVSAPLALDASARSAARLSLLDSLGVACLGAQHPDCAPLLGPLCSPPDRAGGTPIPGTSHRVGLHDAAFGITAAIRWLDFNDTWLAAEWSHPSDNLGAILAVSDQLSRRRRVAGQPPLRVVDLLEPICKAYEIQGVLATASCLHDRGLDHVLLVEVASAAVGAGLLGADEQQVRAAISNALADASTLRVYRHQPVVSWRKSWAAAEAVQRALRFAFLALRGDRGCPRVISAPTWGLNAVLGEGAVRLGGPLGCAVAPQVLYKVPWPAEYHGQSAVEAAIRLRPALAGRLGEVRAVQVRTQRSGVTILDKRGPLPTAADRDHCLQYMVAAALVYGELDYSTYEDQAAQNPELERMRGLIRVSEDPEYTIAYHDPDRRAVANSVAVELIGGQWLGPEEVWYPLGHPRRRPEALLPLRRKLTRNLGRVPFAADRIGDLERLFDDPERLDDLPIPELLDRLSA